MITPKMKLGFKSNYYCAMASTMTTTTTTSTSTTSSDTKKNILSNSSSKSSSNYNYKFNEVRLAGFFLKASYSVFMTVTFAIRDIAVV